MKRKELFCLLTLLFVSACNTTNSNSIANISSNNAFISSESSLLSSLSSSSVNNKVTLEDISEKLLGEIGQQEVLKSSKVDFVEVDKRGDARITTYKETMNIYNDYTSVANGSVETKYLVNETESKKEDTYQRVATAIMYDTTPIFYLVTDYQDGTLNTSWQDSADRLPIKDIGDPNYDGIDFLLSSSLPGQTTKQVSLIISNFISMYLLGNPDLQTTMPYALYEQNNRVTTYKLDDFSYSYSDSDGSKVKTELGFNIVVENGFLKEASTLYRTTTTRDEEVYVEENTTLYTLTYETRVASTTNSEMLNVEDYFIYEVNDVQAYYYNDEGKKEIASLNNLPLEKYVRFEAINYIPLKAVDVEMYAISTSDEEVVSISGNVFYTKASGDAKLSLMSATGITFEVDVRVNIPEITKIKYDDSSSEVERGDNNERYLYTSTTYNQGIYVTISPTGALIDDVMVQSSNEDVLQVQTNKVGKLLELTLTISDNVDVNVVNSVSLIFTSKVDSSIKTEITFILKKRLTNEEIIQKLMNNTYRWNNLYDKNTYGLMTFSSSTEGKVEYYDANGLVGTTTFTYSIKNTLFNIKAIDGSLYGYNSGEITLDGEKIIARVDDVTYVHRYVIVEN